MAEDSTAPDAPPRASPKHYYPLFLDLAGRLTVVVGGGLVAEEKVEGLLAAGSLVRVVSADLCSSLRALAQRGVIEHVERGYRDGDLDGAFLVFAERSDRETCRAVFAEAERRGIFCNVQDDVPLCSAIAPSILRRGELAIAISTAGAAPAFAVRLRQRLEREIGPELAQALALARRVRRPLAETVQDFGERKRRWYRLADSEILELLAAGRHDEAEQLVETILGVPLDAP